MKFNRFTDAGIHTGVAYALFAAVLFGASTPFAKSLVGRIEPVVLAGILYLGSGLGLAVVYAVRAIAGRHRQRDVAGLTVGDLPWLAGAIAAGGVAGPVLLMLGLTKTAAASASLLLNMEGVLTSMLAWFVFRENFDRRIFIGMVLIVVGGALLSLDGSGALGVSWGALAIIGASLCWAIDNNLTRKVSASDAVQIAGLKGLIAGTVNLSIGLAFGMSLPAPLTTLGAGLIGFCGYGLSLVMFVLALRHLGTARTGAYFSAAPFVGASISMVFLAERPGPLFWFAVALMGTGIWLHLTESHEHEHTHDLMEHTHEHSHDEHHQHEHDVEWDGREPHVHPHMHVPLTHSHKHYPDIHHRHDH
ncbi:DMT family transporter [Pseudoduganella sp. UC29_106]|uniref:DMT family transporter n=1 Tax=Pseudoduganella sp. UC29_106 TaxID=3374553 RepID=UPI003757B9F3